MYPYVVSSLLEIVLSEVHILSLVVSSTKVSKRVRGSVISARLFFLESKRNVSSSSLHCPNGGFFVPDIILDERQRLNRFVSSVISSRGVLATRECFRPGNFFFLESKTRNSPSLLLRPDGVLLLREIFLGEGLSLNLLVSSSVSSTGVQVSQGSLWLGSFFISVSKIGASSLQR